MIRNIFKFAVFLLVAMSSTLVACRSDSPDDPSKRVDRTVLVYMVANNDLGSRGLDRLDLEEMETAVAAGALRHGGRLFVYHNAPDGTNTLFEIDSKGRRVVHATYDSLEPGESLSSAQMREVIDEVRRTGESDNIGLVLWSHGTGWMNDSRSRSAGLPAPETTTLPDVVHYSFGLDYKKRMTLLELADALEGQNLEWIYFDCCYMGTVEVVYELRDCARRFVGSTTELPLNGMPYDLNLPMFFTPGESDLVGAARNTYEYYNAKTSGSERFCTMTVIDASKLEALAAATRRVMENAAPSADAYYDGIPYMRGVCTIYDMADYIGSLNPPTAILDEWRLAYNAAITYSAATPECLGLDLSAYTGLGCQIVRSPGLAGLYSYDQCSWWSDVASRNAGFTR